MIKDIMEGNPALGAQTGSNGAHITDRLRGMIPTNYVKSVLDQDMQASVILALFIGVALTAANSKTTDLMKGFFQAMQEISLKVIEWAMKLAPVNTLVLEPGRYSFMNFVKVGLPLLFLTLVITVWLAGVIYMR
jgi:Na+/H+-dicarboxylate symporter